MANKYRATKVYYSSLLKRELTNYEYQQSSYRSFGKIIKFDSRFEYQVFQTLQQSYLAKEIIPHCPIALLPPCKVFPKGKTWKVDFLVKGHNDSTLLLVEAKGIVNREFPWILALLELNNLDLFQRLWLVFNRIPSNNVIKILRRHDYPKIVTLSQFRKTII